MPPAEGDARLIQNRCHFLNRLCAVTVFGIGVEQMQGQFAVKVRINPHGKVRNLEHDKSVLPLISSGDVAKAGKIGAQLVFGLGREGVCRQQDYRLKLPIRILRQPSQTGPKG